MIAAEPWARVTRAQRTHAEASCGHRPTGRPPPTAARPLSGTSARGSTDHESTLHRRHRHHQHRGQPSCACSGVELYLLNRGGHHVELLGSQSLVADIHRPDDVRAALRDLEFDVVVDWIAYTPDDVERDIGLFRGRTAQFVFISSASVYEKPPTHYLITEATPLHNPYWEYARNKIACEERLMGAHRDEGFPVTSCAPR